MERGQWKSQVGFLLAAVGSAIGLGNIWKFPYLCYEHGGGAFLVPYLIALATVGIPLILLEISLGHMHKGSAPLAFHRIAPKWEWIGWFPLVFVMFGIMLYYCVIIGWCFDYLWYSIRLDWGNDPKSFFFDKFLQHKPIGEMGALVPHVLIGTGVAWLAVWIICFKRVEHGIERACKIFIPLLFILTGFMVVYVLFFPGLRGASDGIRFYLEPRLEALKKPEAWVAAYGQIFFSLSVGFGIMLAYASYLPKKARIVKGALLTAIINCGYSIFNGFAVFGVVGHLAQIEGKPIQEVMDKGVGLAFVVYPKVISQFQSAAGLFGFTFFLVLILAGISSAISIVEAVASGLQDKFGFSRGKVITASCGLGLLGSLLFCHRAGLLWLDITDHFIQDYGLLVVGLIECIVVGWVFRTHLLEKHIQDHSILGPRITSIWANLIRFVAPATLIGLLILSVYTLLTSGYGDYPVWALLVLGVFWIVATHDIGRSLSILPWKQEPHHEDEPKEDRELSAEVTP